MDPTSSTVRLKRAFKSSFPSTNHIRQGQRLTFEEMIFIGKSSILVSSASVLAKLRLRPSSILRVSFSTPLYFAPHVRMAQTITANAALGLTKPSSVAIPQVSIFTCVLSLQTICSTKFLSEIPRFCFVGSF